MRKPIVFLIVWLLSGWGASTSHAQTNQNSTKHNAIIEVLYFHATGRCPACLAVENNTKKFLEESFKTEIESGLISFSSVNFDEKEGRKLADKYEVAFSSLLIITKKQKEEKTDLTTDAFLYAMNDPDKFKNLLVIEIQKKLNAQ